MKKNEEIEINLFKKMKLITRSTNYVYFFLRVARFDYFRQFKLNIILYEYNII